MPFQPKEINIFSDNQRAGGNYAFNWLHLTNNHKHKSTPWSDVFDYIAYKEEVIMLPSNK